MTSKEFSLIFLGIAIWAIWNRVGSIIIVLWFVFTGPALDLGTRSRYKRKHRKNHKKSSLRTSHRLSRCSSFFFTKIWHYNYYWHYCHYYYYLNLSFWVVSQLDFFSFVKRDLICCSSQQTAAVSNKPIFLAPVQEAVFSFSKFQSNT